MDWLTLNISLFLAPLRPEVKHASALSLASNGNPFLDEETGGSGTDDQNNYAPDVEVMQKYANLT